MTNLLNDDLDVNPQLTNLPILKPVGQSDSSPLLLIELKQGVRTDCVELYLYQLSDDLWVDIIVQYNHDHQWWEASTTLNGIHRIQCEYRK